MQLQSKTKLTPSMPTSFHGGTLQRMCDCGQHTVAGGECNECGKNKMSLQCETSDGELGIRNSGGLPSLVHDALRSPGQPLDHETRAFMEPRFGFNFANVQVHTDDRAAESSSRIGALAYTANESVVFSRGQYAPHTPRGRHLLAHELAHVVQQTQSIGTASSAESLGQGDSSEAAAEGAADSVVNNSRHRGLATTLSATPAGAIQRTVDDPHRLRSDGSPE